MLVLGFASLDIGGLWGVDEGPGKLRGSGEQLWDQAKTIDNSNFYHLLFHVSWCRGSPVCIPEPPSPWEEQHPSYLLCVSPLKLFWGGRKARGVIFGWGRGGGFSVLAASKTPARLEPGESYGDKEKGMEPVRLSRVLELLHFICGSLGSFSNKLCECLHPL